MEDKLYELRNGNTNANKESDDLENDIIIDVDEKQNQENLMPEFITKTDNAQRICELIKDNNDKVEALKARFQKATTSVAEKEISRQLDNVIEYNRKLNEQLKEVMQSISDDVESAQINQPNEPETRMKIDMQNAITLKVQDILKQTQSVQMEYRTGLKSKITRQTNLLDPTLSEEQVQEIVDDPDKAQQLLQQKLYGQASVQLQNAVADIQDKYRDILKLEQSVNQVFQLFQDLALLVHNQGQVIDNIELNMNKAKNYVAKGEKQLIKAKEEHQASRKKMCCLVMTGLVIILVIVGPVLGTSL